MKNLAIIPARSGSKGLKNKNIKLLNGIPLMAYSIKAAQESGMFDEIMVSTDSLEYAEIAKKYGANVPFFRSERLSNDQASSWDVVIEVLQCYQKLGYVFDTVCLLQPTSPLRTADDIVGGYNLLRSKHADAVTSVCEVEHSPLWCMALGEDLSLEHFYKNLQDAPRQNLPVFYSLNGALYIKHVYYRGDNLCLCEESNFAYIMPRERSVDIDVLTDFLYAEQMLKMSSRGGHGEIINMYTSTVLGRCA